MIGLQINKGELDRTIGENTASLHREYTRAVAIKEFFDRTSDKNLTDLGYTTEEVAIMKSAYADLAYQKTTAFDSSQNVKLLYGLGL